VPRKLRPGAFWWGFWRHGKQRWVLRLAGGRAGWLAGWRAGEEGASSQPASQSFGPPVALPASPASHLERTPPAWLCREKALPVASMTTDDALEQIENVGAGTTALCWCIYFIYFFPPCSRHVLPPLCSLRGQLLPRRCIPISPEQPCPSAPATCPRALSTYLQVGHDFFLFKDSEDGGALKVLYRRK
jgi:hypothetical protein